MRRSELSYLLGSLRDGRACRIETCKYSQPMVSFCLTELLRNVADCLPGAREVAVQRSLYDSWATKADRWPAGCLAHDSGSSVHICLSSDEEESSLPDMDNVHASLSCIDTTDLEENSETNSDVFTYFDTEVLACD